MQKLQGSFFVNNKPVTLITGARQVGKSTLCRELVKECGFNYVSLDNSRELSSAVNDPAYFLSMHKPPLIIDEIQKCKALFAEIESIVNEAKFNGKDNSGIICSTKEPYVLGNGYFAVPICSL